MKVDYLHRASIQGAMVHHHLREEIQLERSHHLGLSQTTSTNSVYCLTPKQRTSKSPAGLNTQPHKKTLKPQKQKLGETSNRHHRNRLDWERDMESQIKKGM